LKLIAQVVDEKMKTFNKKRLNGETDLPLFYSALNLTLAAKGTRIRVEEAEMIDNLWKQYSFNLMNKAIITTEKPELKEDVDEYVKKVKRKYVQERKLAEERLLRLADNYSPLIHSFLRPYTEIRKAEVAEETIGDDIIGVL